MLASKLIAKLNELVEEYGDLEVFIDKDNGTQELNCCSFFHGYPDDEDAIELDKTDHFAVF